MNAGPDQRGPGRADDRQCGLRGDIAETRLGFVEGGLPRLGPEGGGSKGQKLKLPLQTVEAGSGFGQDPAGLASRLRWDAAGQQGAAMGGGPNGERQSHRHPRNHERRPRPPTPWQEQHHGGGRQDDGRNQSRRRGTKPLARQQRQEGGGRQPPAGTRKDAQMTHPWRLKEMTPAEARDRLRATGRILLPSGTMELRGPHLPLGCDTIILDRLADDLSSRTGIPRAPTVEFGVHSRQDEAGPGTASLSRKTLHRVMNELIAAWEEDGGVGEFLVLTAHAVEAHQEALSTIRARGLVRVVDIFGFDFSGLLEVSGGPLHGGELDTSLLLHLRPDLVRTTAATTRLRASAEKGKRLYDYVLQQIAQRWLLREP